VKQVKFDTRARSWRASGESFFAAALGCVMLLCSGTASASTLTISGTPAKTITAGSTYSFTPTAKDSLTGRKLTFVIVFKPSWASFSSTTGTLSGTPKAANVGKYTNIEIEVNDGINAAVLTSFSITVTAASGGSPAPPASGGITISGTPPSTVTAGSAYSFTPTAKDSRTGRTLSFGIVDKPSWASFSSATGKLSGTPSAANVGKFANIEITVNDGVTAAVLPSFAITVQSASGSAPPTVTISGTPATSVTEGKTYTFQPTAKDSAGRTLSYSVANKPSWATFSIASGLLTGTPTQIGSYSNIIVSASDGKASSSLAPFAIKVVAPPAATGSATLQWSDPTKNTNGTTLSNLAGVRLYYGPSQSAMTNEVTIASTSETTYTVSGLTAGTWYFGATAYTTTGMVSALSPIGSKTIQ
jgi:hypothetical protein